MASTFAPLAYSLHNSVEFGITDDEQDSKETARYPEANTYSQIEKAFSFKNGVTNYADSVATSLYVGIPRIGSGGIVHNLQDKIDSQSIAFTSKLVAVFWLLAIPFWPVDMITFAFAFSTLLIGVDRAWQNRKNGLLEIPKQIGTVVLFCLFCFWALGIADVLVNLMWDAYDKNWLRQSSVVVFTGLGLSIIAKWAIHAYYAISNGDIMQKRLAYCVDVIRGSHDDNF